MTAWTILFDIDGTLMTSSGAGSHAMSLAVKDLYALDSIPEVPVHGRTDRGILQELFSKIDLPYAQNCDAFCRRYHELLPDSLVQQNGRLLPAVLPILDQLQADPNVELGILTGNMKAAADIKLRHIGIADYFCFGGYGDDHADRNDVARAAVQEAKRALGDRFSIDNTWVIGDTPNDIRCARAIGARVVAVQTGGCSAEELAQANPDLQLADLTHAQRWVDSL